MSLRPRIFVADRVLPSVVERLRAEFDLVDGLDQRPDGILATITVRIDAAYLDAAGPTLRIVANCGAGVNNIDLAAAAARDVVVTNTPDVLTAATAEFTVGLMLSLLRRISEGDRMLRARTPWAFALDFMLGESLSGKTLAVVGPGRIGTATADLARAFGARPVFVGRHDRLADSIGDADVVSLHCPLTATTSRLINAESLRHMKRSAVVINTARGGLIDEAALADALEGGMLGGAALDVFEHEPRVTERLLALPNVVVTPHLGSGTLATREAMGFLAVSSLSELLIEGRTPATQVRPSDGAVD
jgi:glyoxylate reductase